MAEHVELYKDDADEWRWRRVAENGNVTADSGEGYARRIDCLEMATEINPDLEIKEEQ